MQSCWMHMCYCVILLVVLSKNRVRSMFVSASRAKPVSRGKILRVCVRTVFRFAHTSVLSYPCVAFLKRVAGQTSARAAKERAQGLRIRRDRAA